MKNNFVKIKTLAETVYVKATDIHSIEKSDGGAIIITTSERSFFDVIEYDDVPCDSIEDIIDRLNYVDLY